MSVSTSIFFCGAAMLFASCNQRIPRSNEGIVTAVSALDTAVKIEAASVHSTVPALQKSQQSGHQSQPSLLPSAAIDTKNTSPQQVMAVAESLIGTPYVYASSNPAVGFDCSGFITYVFNQFGIRVPRSSIEFTNAGKEITQAAAQRGDIILFTGTNHLERYVGHMGLIVSNTDTLRFIHSTSGKAMGVAVSPLTRYYQNRLVKVIRIFP